MVIFKFFFFSRGYCFLLLFSMGECWFLVCWDFCELWILFSVIVGDEKIRGKIVNDFFLVLNW